MFDSHPAYHYNVIYGEHWHDEIKDEIRDAELKKLGYSVFRIKSKERIENKIREILRLV